MSLLKLLRIALFGLLFPLLPEAAQAQAREATAEELYVQGLRAMQRGYYTRALELFTRVRNYHRDDPLSVKAQLAIADYDSLAASQVVPRLASLDVAELAAVRAYEAAHRGRRTILNRVDQLLEQRGASGA